MSYRLKLLAFLVLACLPALPPSSAASCCAKASSTSDPSSDSAKLSNIGRGREVAVMQRATGLGQRDGHSRAVYTPRTRERSRPQRYRLDRGQGRHHHHDARRRQDSLRRSLRLRDGSQQARRTSRRGAGCHAPLRAHRGVLSRSRRWPPRRPIAPPTFAGRLRPPMPLPVLRPRCAIPRCATRSTKTSCGG